MEQSLYNIQLLAFPCCRSCSRAIVPVQQRLQQSNDRNAHLKSKVLNSFVRNSKRLEPLLIFYSHHRRTACHDRKMKPKSPSIVQYPYWWLSKELAFFFLSKSKELAKSQLLVYNCNLSGLPSDRGPPFSVETGPHVRRGFRSFVRSLFNQSFGLSWAGS
jgi:hypothetical protein